MMNSTVAHIHTNDAHDNPSVFTSHKHNDLSLPAQAEGLLSGDEMVYTEEHSSIFNELATPWLNWNYSSTTEWIGLITSKVQLNLCVDPRLTIGTPEDMGQPPLVGTLRSSMSGSSHEAYQHDPGVKQTLLCLQETSVLDEGSINDGMFTAAVERNFEANPEATEAAPRVVTHGVRGAKSRGKWRSGVGLSGEMYHSKMVSPGSAIPTKRKTQPIKAPRVSVGWAREYNGQEPDLERDSLGYATPAVALDRLARGRPLKVDCMDRIFFPPNQKRAKSPTRGYICHVQRKIVHQGRGEVAWEPVVTKCKTQLTADSYKRHLLNCHLARPRANKKSCSVKGPPTRMVATPSSNAIDCGRGHPPQSSAEGSGIGNERGALRTTVPIVPGVSLQLEDTRNARE